MALELVSGVICKGSGVLLKDPGVLLKDPGVFKNDPRALAVAPVPAASPAPNFKGGIL